VLAQPSGIPFSVVAKRKVVTDDEAVSMDVSDQYFIQKSLCRCPRQFGIEMQNDRRRHSQSFERRQIVLKRCDRLRTLCGSKHRCGMAIERDQDTRTTVLLCDLHGVPNHRLVP
jgi:hypothetical protein